MPGSPLSSITSQSLLKLMSIESVMLSNHLIHCYPFLLLPSVLPSTGVFSNELAIHIRWPKYWCFSNSPFNDYSKAPVLQCSAFFMVQLPHMYVTVCDYYCLCFLMLFRLSRLSFPSGSDSKESACKVGDVGSIPGLGRFLREGGGYPLRYSCLENPRDGGDWQATVHGLQSQRWHDWATNSLFSLLDCHSSPSKEQMSFNFMIAVTVHSDFGAQENKICYCFHFFSLYLPWDNGTRCHDLSFFLNV